MAIVPYSGTPTSKAGWFFIWHFSGTVTHYKGFKMAQKPRSKEYQRFVCWHTCSKVPAHMLQTVGIPHFLLWHFS